MVGRGKNGGKKKISVNLHFFTSLSSTQMTAQILRAVELTKRNNPEY